MKKIVLIAVTITILSACSNAGNSPTISADTLKSGQSSTVDTTVQPDGVATGTVIATDTGSMKNTFKKKSDSIK